MTIMELARPPAPTETKVFGPIEYLENSGGIELIINLANHVPDPEQAFDAARAYGNLLRSRLEESNEPVFVIVKGSRVYLSLEED